MSVRLAALTLVMIATAACGRCGGGPADQSREERDVSAPAATGPEHDIPNELQLEPDVLRDVRMTTAAVESRAAAESSSMLVGELHVNEQRYGEVFAPVTGRVSRVFADVGSRVRAGDQLAEIQSTELGRASAAWF